MTKASPKIKLSDVERVVFIKLIYVNNESTKNIKIIIQTFVYYVTSSKNLYI